MCYYFQSITTPKRGGLIGTLKGSFVSRRALRDSEFLSRNLEKEDSAQTTELRAGFFLLISFGNQDLSLCPDRCLQLA
jgi:hypothetical protein